MVIEIWHHKALNKFTFFTLLTLLYFTIFDTTGRHIRTLDTVLSRN